MTTILDPSAVNNDKFTSWNTSQTMLGQVFDTVAATVSMHLRQIAKTRALVLQVYNSLS
jgi:hypothetical protein